MDTRRIPINVSSNTVTAASSNSPINTTTTTTNNNHQSDFPSQSLRLGTLGTIGTTGTSDIREKMNQRMREFEEESRKWRDKFGGGFSSTLDRPRMQLNFPEFPELGSGWPSDQRTSLLSRSDPFAERTSLFAAQPTLTTTHKSFIEEDNDGTKKYKVQFEIGDFKPTDLLVKTEGRMLVVKGDRAVTAGAATESKTFNREITLPDFVEPTAVTSYFVDGVLNVEAPVVMDRFAVANSGANLTSSNSSMFSSSNQSRPFRDNISPPRSLLSNMTTGLLGRSNDPFLAKESLFGDNNHSSIVTNQSIGSISSSAASYKFNMSEFRPEDISISVTDTTLRIHALREENEPRGVGKTYREFKREIGLPQGADVKRLKNALQADGQLVIEIPVQDNSSLRPPLSPTGFSKQFEGFSLNDNFGKVMSSRSDALSNPAESFNLDDKELKITFDLSGYRPEDVNVKVTDHTLKVNAVHIDNSKGNQIHREYSRSYILPEWVNVELLRARMSDSGTLTVEVPVPQVQPSKLERVIKIQQL